MYKLMLVLILFFSIRVNCQDADTTNNRTNILFNQKYLIPKPGDTVFTQVDKEAEFKGGIRGWQKYLMENSVFDILVRNNAPGGTYRVVIKFVIAADGKPHDFEPETNFGYGMEKELIRIIKKGPKWTPAEQNGHPVNSYRYQAVTFVNENRS